MKAEELKHAGRLLERLETAEQMQLESGKRDLHFELQLGTIDAADSDSIDTASLYFLIEKRLAAEVLRLIVDRLEEELKEMGIKR